MQHGQVRAILARHAQTGPASLATDRPADPSTLVPAGALRRALEGRGETAQRALALDYVRLWARTFRPLVRHLRGRPERALALFAEEVYPFLRGDRRAARVERIAAREARVLLADDLPAPYLTGLLEGFVALSGAQASARAEGGGAFSLSFRPGPGDRLARAAQLLAAVRLPLVACALLSAATGIALGGAAAAAEGSWNPLMAAAVLAGVGAAQVGANALHELRRPGANPLGPVRLPRAVLRAGAGLAYGTAATCGLVVAWGAGPAMPGVLAFAVAGLALGVAYARVRGSGLGPAMAGLTYGALVPAGAAYALDPSLASALLAASLAAPLGLMATALLLLDNMADRPLDEAGGQRTLAVRLGSRHQATVFTGLVAAALLWLAATSWPWFSPVPMAAAVLLAIPSAWVVRRVWTRGGDPRALGAARIATFAILVATAATPVALFGLALALAPAVVA